MVVTGPGVLEQIPAIIAELDIPERGLIVCDTNTLELQEQVMIIWKQGPSYAKGGNQRS